MSPLFNIGKSVIYLHHFGEFESSKLESDESESLSELDIVDLPVFSIGGEFLGF